jgi:prophage regulatory protein
MPNTAQKVPKKATSMEVKPLFLDRETVAAHISISVKTLTRMVAKGAFPQPRQLNGRRVAWLTSEVEEWAKSRPVSSNLPVVNCGKKKVVPHD